MHKENSWVNVRTQVITGVNKPPGSPRMWINRALEVAGIDIGQGVIRPKKITVAAVWFRPCVTLPLPYNSLTRFFNYDVNKRYSVSNRVPVKKAIGIAWEVPVDEIVQVIRLLNMSGAEMIWWARPLIEREREKTLVELGLRHKLDHADLYKMFEAGQTVRQVADAYSMLTATVRYVHRKWQQGKPSCHMHFGRKPLDHLAVLDDLRTPDTTMQTIADKHGCTRYTVQKIAKAHNIIRA